jgi:sigma-B regulation protein RsbU (phosphoserine phosphatase)
MQFATVLYGVLECHSRAFSYARAGHEAPILLLPDGRIETIDHSLGMVLGMYKKVVLDEQRLRLEPGTTLLLYTDGVVDSQDKDGNSFGLQGIKETLANCHGYSAQEICDLLVESLEIYQQNGQQYDDLAVVALQAEE